MHALPARRRAPILVVTPIDPRAPRGGLLMRVETAIEALAEVAPVEVVVIQPGSEGRPREEGPLPSSIHRVGTFTFTRRLSARSRLAWVLRPTRPLNLVGRDYSQMRRDLRAWMSPGYCLVWVVGTSLYDGVSPVLPACPVVVDVNDLESDKLAAELLVRRTASPPRGLASRGRRRIALLQGRRNVRAWLRFDEGVTRAVDLSLVCSVADVQTLDGARVVVVPNTYPTPSRPLGRVAVGDPPTVLLQGSMAYPPNADAAEFLVQEILPRLRRDVPDVRVRIVGKVGDRVLALADGDLVTVTGYVSDMNAELERADLVVVPVRYGGGTRIKIIEAFAHGIPVVSTRLGAFGLAVSDGNSVLLAEDADSFAQACARVLSDEALRSTMASAGREHFQRFYRAEVVKDEIIDLAAGLATA